MKNLSNTNYLNEEVIRIKLQLLGFDFSSDFKAEKGHQIAKQTFKIDPKSLGMFAPAIKEMTAEVVALYNEFGNKKIIIEYSYKHPFGSNGYTVTLTNDSNSMANWNDESY